MAKREINKLMKHKEKKNEWVGQKCRSREQIREQPHHQMTGGRKLEKRRQSVSWVCCLFRVFFFLYRWTWHFSTSVFYFLHESVLPAASIENLTSILSSVIYSFTCSTDHHLCTYGPQLSFILILFFVSDGLKAITEWLLSSFCSTWPSQKIIFLTLDHMMPHLDRGCVLTSQ